MLKAYYNNSSVGYYSVEDSASTQVELFSKKSFQASLQKVLCSTHYPLYADSGILIEFRGMPLRGHVISLGQRLWTRRSFRILAPRRGAKRGMQILVLIDGERTLIKSERFIIENSPVVGTVIFTTCDIKRILRAMVPTCARHNAQRLISRKVSKCNITLPMTDNDSQECVAGMSSIKEMIGEISKRRKRSCSR